MIKKILSYAKKIYLMPFWMCMGIGGNSGGGNQSSRPLNAAERSALYETSIKNLAQTSPDYFTQSTGADGNTTYGINAPKYSAPSYVDPGTAQTISNGDYNKLQSDLTDGYTAPLDYAKAKDTQNMNDSMAARGLWSSGLADKAILNNVDAVYAPQYAKAGADATNARYGLQSAENQMLNNYNTQNSGAQNTFNLQNATATDSSNWAPLNYLQGLWNGTGGTISNGSQSNFGFSI